MSCLGVWYRGLLDFKAALPSAQRLVVLAQQLFGPRSVGHAQALKGQLLNALLDFKAALPHAQRLVVLAQQLFGPRSAGHAQALTGLCMVQQGLKAFPAARKAISEALAIMEELGLQQDELRLDAGGAGRSGP